MKWFLQFAVVGILTLLIAATPASRIRRQTPTSERLPNSGSQLLQEDQIRALSNLFVRDQRQTQVDFQFPEQFPRSTTSTTTTARPGTSRTTSSPEFLRCLAGCPSVNQYNPVCGSDGENYHNEYKLDCARRCGSLVEMVRAGTCQPL